MRVLILGSGPAAIFAAQAASMFGHDIMLMSKYKKSFMKGAQYLHSPISSLSTDDPFEIDYQLIGDVEGYRKKVYGNDKRVRVSPETLVGQHNAWDIRVAYENGIEKFDGAIHPIELQGGSKEEIDTLIGWAKPHMTISTVPAPFLCHDTSHVFQSERVWSTEVATALAPEFDNIVACSGMPDHAWYRQSRIQGWENTEYPEKMKPPFSASKIHEVVKPISTNCTCHPEVIRAGRYGLWEKGVLADGAYLSAFERFQQISSNGEQGVLL